MIFNLKKSLYYIVILLKSTTCVAFRTHHLSNNFEGIFLFTHCALICQFHI